MNLKKLLALLLVATMLLSSISFSAFADGSAATDGEGLGEGAIALDQAFDGEGTEESPYLINNLDDLEAFRDSVNNGTSYDGKYFKLTDDIDLSGVENWTPIGVNGSHANEKSFRGYFDGNNKTIKNLTINDTTSTAEKLGLFGHIHGDGMKNTLEPSVKDLYLTNVNITSTDSASRIGGLVGNPYTCYIKNVHVSGTIEGGKWTGGIAGNCYTLFENCSFTGTVDSNNQAGGIVGAGDARVYDSKVVGDITAEYWAGGIIGNGQEGASAVGCYAKGDVSVSNNWYFGVGGIAGVGGHGYDGSEYRNNYFDGEVFLCGEKVNAVVVGFVNAKSNADINTEVDGNSWNTEYYSAKTPVVVTAETASDSSPAEWEASASEEKSSVRNNNLVMLESDLQYVDAASAESVTIMTFSDVNEDAVATAVVENKYKAYIDKNKNGEFDEDTEVKYTELQDAFDAATEGDRIDLMGKTIALKGGNHLKVSKDITMENGIIDITDTVWTANSVFYVTGGKAEDFVTLTLNNVDFIGDNYSSAFGVIYVENNGGAVINDCNFNLSNEMNGSGGVLKGNGISQSAFEVKNSTFTLENPSRVITNATVDLEGVTIDAKVTDDTLVSGDTNNHAFRNVVGTISNSAITADGFETGIKNTSGTLSISDNSVVTLKNSVVTDLIVDDEGALEIDYTSTVSAETKDIAEGSVDGAVNPVVVVGEKAFSTLDEALDYALNNNTKTIEVTVLDDISFSEKFANFDKITFNGTNREQTVDLNINKSFDTNVALEFNNLTVSRLDSNWLYNYFYIRGGLAFNNCKMIGLFNVTVQDTSFTNCDFYNDDTFGDGNYSLWLYNCYDGVEVNVKDCTFDVYERAIKMYGDGYSENMVLNISGTEFTSRTADKTVVEMAYDQSTGAGVMNLNISNSSATGFGAPEHIDGDENAWFNVEGSKTLSTVKIDGKVAYSDFAVMSGDKFYTNLQEAVDNAEDGDTITLLSDIEYTQSNAFVNGTWLDGVKYTGDKSFTVDLNGYTISENNDLNDYLLCFNNKGSKENTITLKNGTISGGANLWAVICVGSSSSAYPTTINLGEDLIVKADGTDNTGEDCVIKTRYGSVLNVLDGATVISDNTMYGVQAGVASDDSISEVNIYDGADIIHNNNGSAVSGTGVVNIYGGSIESKGWGVYTCTTGTPDFTIAGGTITGANGAVASAASFDQDDDAAPVVTITGGTFNGTVGTYNYGTSSVNNSAEMIISGGLFSTDVSKYVTEGFKASINAEGGYVIVPERSLFVATDKPEVEKGEEITVSVILENGKDIANGSWTITYDPEKFELKGAANNTGEINDYLSNEKETDEVYNTGDVMKSYTFITKAQPAKTTGEFAISNTKASTWVESFDGVKDTDAKNNGKVTVDINMIDYTVTAKLGENQVGDTAEITYNGDAHSFVVETSLGNDVDCTITYILEDEETDEVSVTEAGTYNIEYKIITEDGYENKTGKVTITVLDPEFEVEVVQWTNMGKKIVLVYTMQDNLYFTYSDNLMIDVSKQENYTYNGEKYNNVFAFVTDSLDTETYTASVADYKAKIDYMSDKTGVFAIDLYDSDINFTKDLNVQDITTEFGVANLHSVLYGNVKYQKQILKADTNGSKNVNGDDTGKVVSDVKAALGIN